MIRPTLEHSLREGFFTVAAGIASKSSVESVDELSDNVNNRPYPDYRFRRCWLGPHDSPPIHEDLIPNDGFLTGLAHGFGQQAALVPILPGPPIGDTF